MECLIGWSGGTLAARRSDHDAQRIDGACLPRRYSLYYCFGIFGMEGKTSLKAEGTEFSSCQSCLNLIPPESQLRLA